MTTQPQQQSHRSLSIFSISHIRSWSSTGFRSVQPQNSGNYIRSPSSLSCDPYRQPAPSPEPSTAVSNVIAQGSTHGLATSKSNGDSLSHIRNLASRPPPPLKPRPRSWFPLSRASLRKSDVLRPFINSSNDIAPNSSATVRNLISAPVLTGTTNMDVAQTEGVCCRDVVEVGLEKSSEATSRSTKFGRVEQDKLTQLLPRRLHSLRMPKSRKKRQEKTLSLVFDGDGHNDTESREDSWRFSAVESGIARRKTEAINLCRQKINKLTGHGHVKRKSVNKESQSGLRLRPNTAGNDTVTQSQTKLTTRGSLLINFSRSDSDIRSGSLSRSFASAIDKLDFHPSPIASNMGFMKSKSSIFSLKKRVTAEDGKASSQRDDKQKFPAVTGPVNNSTDTNADQTGMTMSEALKHLQPPPADLGSQIVRAHPEPMQFSAAANGYVPGLPDSRYPKGIKALGMHSNTMDFATAPVWITDLPKPPRRIDEVVSNPNLVVDSAKMEIDEKNHVKDGLNIGDSDNEEDGEEVVIEDAPIYSPSLGDLSQYARPSPASADPVSKMQERKVQEANTQAKTERGYLRRLGLRKSKSALSLLGMFHRGRKNSKEDRALQTRDVNQSIKPQQLKKSRSMNLAAMLRKTENTSISEPLLQAEEEPPIFPSVPQSVPQASNIQDEPSKESQMTYGAIKRTPPKGSITPSDRAKRMGIVGMPQPNCEEHIQGVQDCIGESICALRPKL